MRAAGAVVMPLRLADPAGQMGKHIDAARKAPQCDGIDFTPPRATAVAFGAAASAFDAKLLTAERSGNVSAIEPLERKAMIARDVFWMLGGLTYNQYWHTIDCFVALLPELNYAAYEIRTETRM